MPEWNAGLVCSQCCSLLGAMFSVAARDICFVPEYDKNVKSLISLTESLVFNTVFYSLCIIFM